MSKAGQGRLAVQPGKQGKFGVSTQSAAQAVHVLLTGPPLLHAKVAIELPGERVLRDALVAYANLEPVPA
jgi:hypothetical protein